MEKPVVKPVKKETWSPLHCNKKPEVKAADII
jgi:hypothetical protein